MSKFTNIKAVLFDMDGTLIEHTWQITQITDALFGKFASELAPLTCEAFYDVFWTKNVDLWYMMIDGVIDGDTAQLYSYVNTLRALEADASLGQAMVDYWTELVLAEATPFEDTQIVLKKTREQFATGIVTNGFSTMQQAKLQTYQLDSAVDFCLISEDARSHKPDAGIFEKALHLAGDIFPAEAIFIGDNLNTDIAGALNAGIQPVLMDPKGEKTPPDGVVKIQSLTELLSLLPFDEA